MYLICNSDIPPVLILFVYFIAICLCEDCITYVSTDFTFYLWHSVSAPQCRNRRWWNLSVMWPAGLLWYSCNWTCSSCRPCWRLAESTAGADVPDMNVGHTTSHGVPTHTHTHTRLLTHSQKHTYTYTNTHSLSFASAWFSYCRIEPLLLR